MSKRILCVLNRIPFPIVGGREKMLCQVLDFLSSSDCEIHLVVFEHKKLREALTPRLNALLQRYPRIADVNILNLPRPFKSMFNIMMHTLFLGRKSMQESLFFSRWAQMKLQRLTKSLRPDIIYCDSARTAQFFESAKTEAVKVFDADDLLSKRYRIIETGGEINLLGTFTEKFPRLLRWMATGTFSWALIRLESRLMYRRENLLGRAFDRVILVSPVEVKELRDRVGKNTIHHIYPTKRVSVLERPEMKKEDRRVIAFMGLLNIPHNQVGLQGFLENVFPRVLERYKDLEFKIIGSHAPEGILELASKCPGKVIFTGFVDNFEAVLKTVHVFVAPIYFGTGIKTKIIDAMAMGLPVVTTPVGAEGLRVQNRENIMIAQDDHQFADYVIELLQDPTLNKHISEQARLYIEEHHNPDKEAQRFRDILGLQPRIGS